MTVPAAKVKSLCTPSEIALVRASRRPAILGLDATQAKRLAGQARKLADKWQGLERGQSRPQRRQSGVGESSQNTQLKEQIFRDALTALEARLAVLAAAAPSAAPSKAGGRQPKTKKKRAAGHRATRAETRQALAQTTAKKNVAAKKKPSKKKPESDAAGATTTLSAQAANKQTSRRKSATSIKSDKKPVRKTANVSLDAAGKQKQQLALTAAKKSRLDRSGKSSRVKGHVAARGRRAQGRRDAR